MGEHFEADLLEPDRRESGFHSDCHTGYSKRRKTGVVRKGFARRDRTGLFSMPKCSLKAGSPSKGSAPVGVTSAVHDRISVIVDPDGYD
jgi:hypothetical protein